MLPQSKTCSEFMVGTAASRDVGEQESPHGSLESPRSWVTFVHSFKVIGSPVSQHLFESLGDPQDGLRRDQPARQNTVEASHQSVAQIGILPLLQKPETRVGLRRAQASDTWNWRAQHRHL